MTSLAVCPSGASSEAIHCETNAPCRNGRASVPLTSSALIWAPRASISVHTTLTIMKRVNQAAPRCDPKKRDDRPCSLGDSRSRMTVNAATASRQSTAKRSSTKPRAGQFPITGMWKVGVNSAPKPSTIVSTRTTNPQKTAACASPGAVQRSSFRWPATSTTSARAMSPLLPSRPGSTGCAEAPTR